MSQKDYSSKRLNREEARKLLAKIVKHHGENIIFSGHARDELLKDGLTMVDAVNVLKSIHSRIENDGELINGTYRYRLQTDIILVVTAFHPKGDGLTVVTAWDKRRR